MKRFVLLLLMLASLAFALPVAAQTTETTVPWYSTDNLTIAAGLNYEWWRAPANGPKLDFDKEWSVGLYNAWTLTKHLDAVLPVEYGVDTKLWNFKLGVRFVLKGSD